MTRKIEQAMIAAIRAGKSWSSGNTAVTMSGDCAFVTLHGNRIAIIGHPVDGTCWSLAGWNTSTTRSRINALAYAFNWKRRVCQSKHDAHVVVDGKVAGDIGERDWIDALA